MSPARQETAYRWEMRAAREPLVRTQVTLPEPGAGEAIVRVVGCGVCHTDIGFLFDGVRTRHPLPLALGHEIAGEVIAVGGLHEQLLGKAVIVPAVIPCGDCEACHDGQGTICPTQKMPGNDIHGGFASHVLVPARGLCLVDDPGALQNQPIGKSGCTLAELAVLADAVTTPYQAICRSGLSDGDLAIVIGLGGVGGFAAQIAHALGAHAVGIDVDSSRLELLSKHGVDLALDPTATEPDALVKRVREFAASRECAARSWRIFECSGTKAGQLLAWRLLVPGAWLSVIGFTLDKLDIRLSNLMAFDAIAAGNWGCAPELYPEALALAVDGRIAVKPFVETFAMDRVAEVLDAVHAHRMKKRPVLVP